MHTLLLCRNVILLKELNINLFLLNLSDYQKREWEMEVFLMVHGRTQVLAGSFGLFL